MLLSLSPHFAPGELRQVYSNSQILDVAGTEKSVIKVSAGPQDARRWRITLLRLGRRDAHAPAVENDPAQTILAFQGQAYSYAGGTQLTPAWPPRRSNPVADNGGASSQNGTIVRAELAWGAGTASPARLAADWPALGGSVVVTGSYVELFATAVFFGDSLFEASPVVTAFMVPDNGIATEDGAELSFTQQINVRPLLDAIPPSTCPTWGGVAYVPDFARRVRVHLVQDDLFSPCANTDSVPDTGDISAQIAWFNDGGVLIDSWFQGNYFPPGSGTPLLAPVEWHPVPANATMLAVRGPVGFNNVAQIHWRIAP